MPSTANSSLKYKNRHLEKKSLWLLLHRAQRCMKNAVLHSSATHQRRSREIWSISNAGFKNGNSYFGRCAVTYVRPPAVAAGFARKWDKTWKKKPLVARFARVNGVHFPKNWQIDIELLSDPFQMEQGRQESRGGQEEVQQLRILSPVIILAIWKWRATFLNDNLRFFFRLRSLLAKAMQQSFTNVIQRLAYFSASRVLPCHEIHF